MSWEYMTLVVSLSDYGGRVSVRNAESVVDEHGNHPPLHQFLNEQGALGWELQATVPYERGQVLMILRRSAEAAERARQGHQPD